MKEIRESKADGSPDPEDCSIVDKLEKRFSSRRRPIGRRAFLGKSFAAGAGAIGAGLLGIHSAAGAPTEIEEDDHGGLSAGDAALLRFPAALELLEADFWIQYNELGGVP